MKCQALFPRKIKEEYMVIILGLFFLFLLKIYMYVVGVHNICFYLENWKKNYHQLKKSSVK